MATITIENVPENIVKKYGTKISFSYNLSFKSDEKELLWTDYEQNVYDEAIKDLQNGNIVDGKEFFNSLLSKSV